MVAEHPAPPDWEAEDRRLRQQVKELQCQKPLYSRVQASHPVQSSVEAAQMVQERAAKPRACAEEVFSASTRRVVVYEASGTHGRFGDWRCISGGGVELTLGHRCCENADIVRGRFHGGKFGEVRILQGKSRREEAQYGLRASRVDEASHPGPPGRQRSNQGVPEDVLDALQYDLTQDDSDSSQPGLQGRQAASVQSQMLTVPASSNEVRVFGRPALPSGSATVLGPADSFARDGGEHQPTYRETDSQMWAHSDQLSRRKIRRLRSVLDSDIDALVVQEGRSRVRQRRVVLVPQEGTPQSIQDREPPTSAPTVPASSGAVRRLVLVNSQQPEPSAAPTSERVSNGVGRQNRFEALRDLEEVRERRSETESADGHENDTDSERGSSEVDEGEAEVDDIPPSGGQVELDVRARYVAIGMASFDEFRLPEIFKQRAREMQTVPLFLKGAFRGALRAVFEEAQCAQDNNDEVRHVRAWKLFMLLPRMLLSRPP